MELPFKEGESFTFLHNGRSRTIKIEKIGTQAVHDSDCWCIVPAKVFRGYIILACTAAGDVAHLQSNLPMIDSMTFRSITEPIVRLTSIGYEVDITDSNGTRWRATLKADGRRDTLKRLSSA